MTRSANEVMVLAAKAARGAGAPPEQAGDFGRAVLRHLHAGRAWRDLAKALGDLPGGPIMDLPVALAQVLEGDAACGQVNASAWLSLAQSYAEALPYAVTVDLTEDQLKITVDLTRPAAKSPLGRFVLPQQLFDQMNRLAVRILVPESDTSRQSGAGAGLTDND